MKQTAYSQFELLALPYRKWRLSEREETVGEAGRDGKPGKRADRDPALPNGYVHIQSAIQALMALTRSPASDAWRSLSSDTSSLG